MSGIPADLEAVTVAELLAGLDAGAFTSVELAEACVERIESLNERGPALHAVRSLALAYRTEARQADEARRAGRVGPLLGIPVLIKDNIDVAGLSTTAGSLALEGLVARNDAGLVRRLKAAGAVILGKTNLTEFANFMATDMPDGYSSLGGQVLNAYDLTLTPSGSSSGAAAAVVTGMAPLAVGTETSGSVLAPAEAQSAVGIKPTVGLVSRTGIVPISPTQDTAGSIARCVADAVALLVAMAGPDPEDPATGGSAAWEAPAGVLDAGALAGTRLGVVTSFDDTLTGGTRPRWAAARSVLEVAGATLVDVDLPAARGDYTVLTYEFGAALDSYLAGAGGGPAGRAPSATLAEVIAFNQAHLGETLKFGQARLLESQAVDPVKDRPRYEHARANDLAETRDRIDAVLAEGDLDSLVYPGVAGYDTGARAGYPSITVPAGYTEDGRRPFGIQFLGRAWEEAKLANLAYSYEQATRLRRPPSEVNPSFLAGTPYARRLG